MVRSVLTLTIGNNQGIGDAEYGSVCAICFPLVYIRLFNGPISSIADMWRIFGRGTANAGLVVCSSIKPKLGLQPGPSGEAGYAFLQEATSPGTLGLEGTRYVT